MTESGHPAEPAVPDPIEIERYQRRWRFVVADLRAAGGPRWMWEGPDGLIDARPFRPIDPHSEVVDALHFWIHDWSFFRGTRRFEHAGREWTVRRSSRVGTGGRIPNAAAPKPDPAGLYFRSDAGETHFVPLELAGPEFVTMPATQLAEHLQRALDRGS
jgi:hypothetical protein